MLAGIVAMQVEVLKLGASMGRSLERNSVLSSENAALRQSVATLGDDQRIERAGGSMGMVMPPPQAVGFLSANADGNAGRALANIHQPSASSFLSLTPTNGEIVTSRHAGRGQRSGRYDRLDLDNRLYADLVDNNPNERRVHVGPDDVSGRGCPDGSVVRRKLDRCDADSRHARAHLILQHGGLESGGHAVTDLSFVHGTVDRRRRRRTAFDHQRGLADPWRGSIVASASSSLRS